MKHNEILYKLRKLLAHAESCREIGNLEEAQAFAAKVQELLTRHQLSMSDVEIRTEEEIAEEPELEHICPEDVGLKWTSRVVVWQAVLLQAIATANNCNMFTSSGTNVLTVVGFQADRQAAIALYGYFVRLGQDLCDGDLRRFKQTPEYALKSRLAGTTPAHYCRQWRTSWLLGFGIALGNRFGQAKARVVEEAQESQALVHFRNKEALVKRWFDDRSEQFRKGGSRGRGHRDAFKAGERAGKSVALTSNTLN